MNALAKKKKLRHMMALKKADNVKLNTAHLQSNMKQAKKYFT